MPAKMIEIISADGVSVRARDQGRGPVVLICHAGMDDGSQWSKVAELLSGRFRIVRLIRRQYRLDLHRVPATFAEEVMDIVALMAMIGEPAVIVGHSSGGVLALEALVAAPERFVGAVIYEAPVVVGAPLGGEGAWDHAKVAVNAGKLARAIAIFMRDAVEVPAFLTPLIGMFVAAAPKYRRFVARQIDDWGAINKLGPRLEAYARINVSTILLGGDRSPSHLGARLDALAAVMPHAERIVLKGQAHSANARAPRDVARVISDVTGR